MKALTFPCEKKILKNPSSENTAGKLMSCAGNDHVRSDPKKKQNFFLHLCIVRNRSGGQYAFTFEIRKYGK